jgi:hypothetical protein
MESLSLIIAIFGIAGTVGGASAIFFFTRNKALIDFYKAENEVITKSNARLDGDLKAALAKADASEDKAKMLESMVTSRPDISKLAKVTATQHQQVIQALSNVVNEISSLTRAITKDKGSK